MTAPKIRPESSAESSKKLTAVIIPFRILLPGGRDRVRDITAAWSFLPAFVIAVVPVAPSVIPVVPSVVPTVTCLSSAVISLPLRSAAAIRHAGRSITAASAAEKQQQKNPTTIHTRETPLGFTVLYVATPTDVPVPHSGDHLFFNSSRLMQAKVFSSPSSASMVSIFSRTARVSGWMAG